MEYNYKEEVNKILKEKNITLYDNRFPENDKRRYDFFPIFAQRVDKAEKALSEEINKINKNNSKKVFIESIKKILEVEQESLKEDNENLNLIPLISYEIGLKMKLMSLYCVFG